MYRAIPVGSKLLQRKWDQKERELHLSKLREAKPSIDVREPTQFRHIKKKLKKNQMQEGTSIRNSQALYRALHRDRKRESNPPREDDSHYANHYKQ
jgi:hypothetical protein